MLNLDKRYLGIVIGKNSKSIFISTTILKPIKYTQTLSTLPTNLSSIDVGDLVEFNLTSSSIPSKIEICNLSIKQVGAYKEYLQMLDKNIDKLPNTIQYPKSKVVSMIAQYTDVIDPLNWIIGMEQVFHLRPLYVSNIELSGGQKIYEPVICFEKIVKDG